MARRKNNRKKTPSQPKAPAPKSSKSPARRASHLTPLEQAQDLIYEAFVQDDPQRAVALARQALEISPDCADAYVVLAEHTPNRKERIQLLTQGVEAGRRTIGKDFDANVGHFWGILETRPYMRTRLGLAGELWQMGRRDEAIEHTRDMLRLNPNDNQGIRYTLAGFLLNLDRDDELNKLLEQYPEEGTATWTYTRALLVFRREGDTPQARELLAAALKSNKHVPAVLLGQMVPPMHGPDAYTLGGESEALVYGQGFLAGWKDTPGAIAWLRANLPDEQLEAPQTQAKGPLGFVKTWAKTKLTQGSDVWQVDVRQVPIWIRNESGPVRPWALLVVEREKGIVLGHEVVTQMPTSSLIWDAVLNVMKSPTEGEPHRPAALEVRSSEEWQTLRPHFEEIGVSLTVVEQLPMFDLAFASLADHLGRDDRPGILDAPDMTPEKAASFYSAAAEFFRQAPWKRAGFEPAIKIESEQFRLGPWYGVLMGQSGLTSGLALYTDYEGLKRLLANDSDDEEDGRNLESMSVTYGEAWTIPLADLTAAEKYGWEVARPDAYPHHMCVANQEFREPLNWERELMEACLRAVPEFVKRRKSDDPTREEFVVAVGGSEVKLTLSWMVEA